MRAVLGKTGRQQKLFVPKRFKTNLLDTSRIFFVPAPPVIYSKLPAGFRIQMLTSLSWEALAYCTISHSG